MGTTDSTGATRPEPSQMRPYLLIGSIVFIAFGFCQARRAKACQHQRSIIASVLLWVSAGFVLISIFFPQVIANAIAGLGTR